MRDIRGNMSDHRYRPAAQMEDQSRHGQSQHMLRHRLVINTMVIDLKYRRLGVAGNILRFAVDHAQSTDWGIWIQTPAAYEGLFWRNGFHEVRAFGPHLNAFEPLDEMTTGLHGTRVNIQTWTDQVK